MLFLCNLLIINTKNTLIYCYPFAQSFSVDFVYTFIIIDV